MYNIQWTVQSLLFSRGHVEKTMTIDILDILKKFSTVGISLVLKDISDFRSLNNGITHLLAHSILTMSNCDK